ncbi:MAG TPA: hydantoinase B/oxoprolinase family protein [Polyangiaceae bacterium]|nr:hydantoinase B/oxoprolinase family protein [Polyangiaceae bacterium]
MFVDRGGTFTDCVLYDRDTQRTSTLKVLSSDEAPLVAIRRLLSLSPDAPIPPCDVRMGTTLATNALLERRGAPTLLVITRGFGDLIEIGTQTRPDLFALAIPPKPRLYSEVLEVDARRSAQGGDLARPRAELVIPELRAARERGLTSAAISVLHDYRDGALELELGNWARQAGFEHVALGHEVCPELGFLNRTEMAVLDAYLTPPLAGYLEFLRRKLPGSRLLVMQSGGALASPERCRGPHAILSGPAGGVVACAKIAESAGLPALIGFDMGGTSTDVCRVGDEFEQRPEQVVAGFRVRTPTLAVHTIAAGGGSLCRFDGHRLSVGPWSSGATPGPLCYGHPAARELTLTDVNLLLGRLLPDAFPFELDAQRAHAGLRELTERVVAANHVRSDLDVAEGLFEIANQSMADAISEVSTRRGYDVRQHSLLVFGGAGGQHACSLVRALGLRQAVFHPLAQVLSAYGIGLSPLGWQGARDVSAERVELTRLTDFEAAFAELETQGHASLQRDGVESVSIERRVELGYAGTEARIPLRLEPVATLAERFHARHVAEFGYSRPDCAIVVQRLRVELRGESHTALPMPGPDGSPSPPNEVLVYTRLYHHGRWHERVPVLQRGALQVGSHLEGPLLVREANGTLVIDPGFSLECRADGLLVARPSAIANALDAVLQPSPDPALQVRSSLDTADPVLLEILSHRFMSVAERMGHALQRSASSVNIRERLDYSCALFDSRGNLIANAPHIPVHLGAMSESVRAVLTLHPEMEPGDAFVTNDPALGGSHLPDVTLVAPVHDAKGRLAFVAARGHHADLGGITPGSMPAFSAHLHEEGVVFRAERAVHDGKLELEWLRERLNSGPFPARHPDQNLADLQAAFSALRTGAGLLLEACKDFGRDTVVRYMEFVQEHAADLVRRAIDELPADELAFEDALDDGTPICVRLVRHADSLEIDFSGTGAQVAGNLNAPRAVTLAGVIYFLRTLVGKPLPLNGGFLRPVRVEIPVGSVLDPAPGAAVAGGNVETSQRVVDALLAAASAAAASQGTMNNLSFGNASFAHYETICGGAGAGPTFDGASAVHTHMTNTRITDVEVLEQRFPIRVREFQIRPGTGGTGRFSGGCGVRRVFEFLTPAEVSFLSERRTRAPFGLAGGGPGATGRQRLNGVDLPGKFSKHVEMGDVLTIETPGGGGYGAA